MLVEEYSKTIRHELLKVLWVMLSHDYSKCCKECDDLGSY